MRQDERDDNTKTRHAVSVSATEGKETVLGLHLSPVGHTY